MTIPITAANPVDAIMLIDFFYQPTIAAKLAEYINYITPGPGRPSSIIKTDAAKADRRRQGGAGAVANSPLVFPSDGRLRASCTTT